MAKPKNFTPEQLAAAAAFLAGQPAAPVAAPASVAPAPFALAVGPVARTFEYTGETRNDKNGRPFILLDTKLAGGKNGGKLVLYTDVLNAIRTGAVKGLK